MSQIVSWAFLAVAVLIGFIGIVIEFHAGTDTASGRGLALCSLAMSAIAGVLRMP